MNARHHAKPLVVCFGLLLSVHASADGGASWGRLTSSIKVKFKNPNRAARWNVPQSSMGRLSFAVDKGVLKLELHATSRSKIWRQAFAIRSDTVGEGGVRTISFQRPRADSRIAQQNRRALAGLLRSFKSLRGGGELKIDGDKVTLVNQGSGKARVLLATRNVTWTDEFKGTVEKHPLGD